MQDYVGYRTKKRMSQKKKKRKALRWLLVPVALIVIFIILGAVVRVSPVSKWWDKTADGFVWLGRKVKAIWPWKGQARLKRERFIREGKKTANYLLAFTKQLNDSTQMTNLVLASFDSRDNSGSLIYFPNDLLVNMPGVGQDLLSNLVELDEGRVSMTVVMVENLIGVEVDRYIMGSDRDLSIMFGKMKKKFTVDAPGKESFRDPSLNVTLGLDAGERELDARQLASYLTYSDPGKSLDLIKRQSGFVPSFMEESRGPDSYNDIPSFMKKEANLFDSDASSTEMAGLWQAYALLKGDKLQQVTVPVKRFHFENTVVHTVDTGKMPAFTNKYVKTDYKKPSGGRVRVEILNGCGVPGIGEKVASQLDLGELRIVNSANADNFDHTETLVIVYSEDKGIVSAAEEIRKDLEVGRIESHPKAQDIADITVIAGKDYASK